MLLDYFGTAVVDGTAHTQAYCRGVNEAKDFGEPCCENRKVGNPINVGTGNKFQLERDYPRTAGSLLSFERYYNSTGHQEIGAGCKGASKHMIIIGIATGRRG